MDGSGPNGDLVYRNGWLYGVTFYGGGMSCGTFTCGTIFAVSTRGQERVLYRFQGKYNAQNPTTGLTDVDGTLYGVTFYGGRSRHFSGGGVVYATGTTPNTERVIFKFKGNPHVGNPIGPLLWNNGFLISGVSGPNGYSGALFGVTPSGGGRTLCKLANGFGAVPPLGGLVDIDDTLYGIGGVGVFSMSQTCVERTVWRFAGKSDGSNPVAPMVGSSGTLYGTTTQGGKYGGCSQGCGTVFSLTPGGQQLVLHRFRGGRDGAGPQQRLTMVGGTLYGTTQGGGGTIFAVTP